MDVRAFDRMVSDAFRGGALLSRELRLTQEQARYLTDRCRASVHPMGGQWYTVTFEEAYQLGC